VKIQQVKISPGKKAGQFLVHVSLVRSVRPDNVATGSVGLSVEGDSDGKTTTVELAALTAGKQRELPFNFRYFENFDQEIALPAGFKPEHLVVEVRSSHKDVPPVNQTFLWSADAS
jgi:hypothetical protein